MAQPRSCPSCKGRFIAGGPVAFDPTRPAGKRVIIDEVPLDPTIRIARSKGESGVRVGRCPHCPQLLTSDDFPSAGQLIPYNAPMLESTCQSIPEGVPLAIPVMGSKLSQDDVAGWMKESNRMAAEGSTKV